MPVIKWDFEFSKDGKRKQASKRKKNNQFLAGLLIVFAGEKKIKIHNTEADKSA